MVKKISWLLAFVIISILLLNTPVFGSLPDYTLNYPILNFTKKSEVQVLGVFDLVYSKLEASKLINDYDQVKISKGEDVVMQLSPLSFLRFKDNTEFEIHANSQNGFEINLINGEIWSNVSDLNLSLVAWPLEIKQNNSVLNIVRTGNKNILTGIKYNTLLNLKKDKKTVNAVYLPSFSQITVLDSQISDAYTKLKQSKLKKELKLTNLTTDQIKANVWFNNNQQEDFVFLSENQVSATQDYSNIVFSEINMNFSNYLNFLVFNQKAKLNQSEQINALYQLAFYFASLGDLDKANEKLEIIDSLYSNLNLEQKEECLLQLVEIYNKNKLISYLDWSYFLKKSVQEKILAVLPEELSKIQQKQFLIDELSNFEKIINEYQIEKANAILKSFFNEFWSLNNLDSEFISQVRTICLYNTFTNLSLINSDYFDSYYLIEPIALAKLSDFEKKETSLELLNERINLSKIALDLHDYKLAKLIIAKNVDLLIVNLENDWNSAKEYIAKLKNEIDQKIAYIEDLHGSSHVDEENYKTHQADAQAEKAAYALFIEYQSAKNLNKDNSNLPKFESEDVVLAFSRFGINLIWTNVKRIDDLPDKFSVKGAITTYGDIFSANYNAEKQTLYDINFWEKEINYSLELSKVSDLLHLEQSNQKINPITIVVTEDPVEKRNNLAFEIKKVILTELLKDNQITFESNQITQDQNGNLKIRVKINEEEVDFSFDEKTKIASKIYVINYGLLNEKSLISDLEAKVKTFITKKDEEKTIEQIKKDLTQNHIIYDTNHILKIEEGIYSLNNLFDQKNKVLFSGNYKVEGKVFTEVNFGDLGLFQNITIENISSQISQLKLAKEQAELEKANAAIQVETNSSELVLEENIE